MVNNMILILLSVIFLGLFIFIMMLWFLRIKHRYELNEEKTRIIDNYNEKIKNRDNAIDELILKYTYAVNALESLPYISHLASCKIDLYKEIIGELDNILYNCKNKT